MEIGEKAEEALETLWILTEEAKKPEIAPEDLAEADKETTKQLLEADYISLSGSGIILTEKGRPLARDIVRRHRLSERLLLDVLDLPEVRARIDSIRVSRHHARISVAGCRAVLEDLGSKNGTFMRGERVEAPVELADGDRITIGEVVLVFRVTGIPGSTQTAQQS